VREFTEHRHDKAALGAMTMKEAVDRDTIPPPWPARPLADECQPVPVRHGTTKLKRPEPGPHVGPGL